MGAFLAFLAFVAALAVCVLVAAAVQARRRKASLPPPSETRLSFLSAMCFLAGLGAVVPVLGAFVVSYLAGMSGLLHLGEEEVRVLRLAERIALYSALVPGVAALAFWLGARAAVREGEGSIRGVALYRAGVVLALVSGYFSLTGKANVLERVLSRTGDGPGVSTSIDLGERAGRPPARLGLSPFYAKHLDEGGLPIVASARVRDEALFAARDVVRRMLAGRPDLREALVRSGTRVAVMAQTEVTTDIPEHADLYEAFPGKDWNKRCRGVGATPARPVCSAGEENLLGLPGDPYRGESILIHELAHTVAVMALPSVDPEFGARLRPCYDAAMARGLWARTYAATSVEEYWAEGVQSWFDANLEGDDSHNDVNTREELENYDPPLAALIAQVFGDSPR